MPFSVGTTPGRVYALPLPFSCGYGTLIGVPLSRKLDLSRWVFTYFVPEGTGAVELKTGAWFPEVLLVTGRYLSGPLLSMSFRVLEGEPTLLSLTIGHEDDLGARVTPSAVHDLPLGQLIGETIARMAEVTLLFRRPDSSGTDAAHRFPSLADGANARKAAVASQRGRPVSDDTLRRVSEIISESPFDPRVKIHEEFNVSSRTASRWIAEAKKRTENGE
jgi:hypothetical protein